MAAYESIKMRLLPAGNNNKLWIISKLVDDPVGFEDSRVQGFK